MDLFGVLVNVKSEVLTRNIEQKGFVVVLHQLNDHSCLFTVIFQTDNSHDIWSVLTIRIIAKFVGYHQARGSLVCPNPLQIKDVHHWPPGKKDGLTTVGQTLGQWVVRPIDPASQHIILRIVGLSDFYRQLGHISKVRSCKLCNKTPVLLCLVCDSSNE